MTESRVFSPFAFRCMFSLVYRLLTFPQLLPSEFLSPSLIPPLPLSPLFHLHSFYPLILLYSLFPLSSLHYPHVLTLLPLSLPSSTLSLNLPTNLSTYLPAYQPPTYLVLYLRCEPTQGLIKRALSITYVNLHPSEMYAFVLINLSK